MTWGGGLAQARLKPVPFLGPRGRQVDSQPVRREVEARLRMDARPVSRAAESEQHRSLPAAAPWFSTPRRPWRVPRSK